MRVVLFWAVFLGVTGLGTGCDPELSEAMSSLQAEAPDICEDFCTSKFECEWEAAAGEYEQGFYDFSVDECIIACAIDYNEGAYVIWEGHNCDPEETCPTERRVLETIPGKRVSQFLDCLGEMFFWVCDTNEEFSFSMFTADWEMIMDTKWGCESYAACREFLDSNYLPRYSWDENEFFGTCRYDDFYDKGGVVPWLVLSDMHPL